MSFFQGFLEGVCEELLFGDSSSENEVEDDSESTYVHHMSDDGELELRLSGNAHSPIE